MQVINLTIKIRKRTSKAMTKITKKLFLCIKHPKNNRKGFRTIKRKWQPKQISKKIQIRKIRIFQVLRLTTKIRTKMLIQILIKDKKTKRALKNISMYRIQTKWRILA